VEKPGGLWFFRNLTSHRAAKLVFQGETAITIDDKGRLAIPTGQREVLACLPDTRLVITYNPFDAGCLWIFPYQKWKEISEEVNKNRVLRRKLVGSAEPALPDGNGRIKIPASMRTAIGIERKAVLLGMGDRFELWSEQAHLEQVQQTLGDDDLGDDLPDGIV